MVNVVQARFHVSRNSRQNSFTVLVLICLTLGIGGCATAPDVPLRNAEDEARRATQVMQEREQELAALRAEMAATRIAAAKQEAELHELRATVSQLRQDNSDSQQALLETKRTLESRQTELAALKTERDQLVQATPHSETSEHRLTALQDTVAALSQELAELKQKLTVVAAKSIDDSTTGHNNVVSEETSQPSVTRAGSLSGSPTTAANGVIHALHVLGEAVDRSKSVWITVQPGDSFWSLARKHKTTIKALRALNGRVGDQLVVGEELRIP